jgi:hypothetical protein
MPLLQYKLAFREVLKYQLDVSMMDDPDDEEAEFELLVVIKVGQDGHFTTETRLQNRSGPIKVPDSFLKPGSYRLAAGEPLPLFFPALPDRAVEAGDLWTVVEKSPKGEVVQVFYELTSLKGPVAEIISRKVVENPRSEIECLYEFDVERGRVVLAQTVTESQVGRGRQSRLLTEYELQED